MKIRLLSPDKKGIGKRISQAIASAGGKVQHTCVKREMRGMSETEILVSFAHESLRTGILESLGRVAGLALIGSDGGAR